MGQMVQQSPLAGTNREYPASRSRGKLLCSPGTIRHGRVTKTNQPPANPARLGHDTCRDLVADKICVADLAGDTLVDVADLIGPEPFHPAQDGVDVGQ